MLFHPNYPCISGHFTVSPQRPWSWWIVTKSWDTNRCPKMWNGEEGDTNNWCLVFWRGVNSANLEIKQHWTYLHAIWYVSINDVVTTWICFLFFFLLASAPGHIDNTWVAHLLPLWPLGSFGDASVAASLWVVPWFSKAEIDAMMKLGLGSHVEIRGPNLGNHRHHGCKPKRETYENPSS